MSNLIIDIGNSNIVVGYYENKWKNIWRIETKKNADKLQYSLKINNLLFENNINPKNFEFIIFSSVVPELTDKFKNLLTAINSKTIHFNKEHFNKLPLTIINKKEIGIDLVSNALACNKLYKTNIIIVDFGTALTFTVVNKQGKILGVNIAPGIKTAIKALDEKTSQLDKVEIKFPKKPIGNNTEEAIQNGILIGYKGLIIEMIKTLKKYYKEEYKIVFTGGLSFLYKDKILIDYFEKNLTLIGLLEAGKLITKIK